MGENTARTPSLHVGFLNLMQHPGTSTIIAECGGVRCTDERLQELDGGRLILSTPVRDVQSITLCEGLLSPHPVVQAVLGLLLAGLGSIPLLHAIQWMREGGTFATAEALFIPLAALGVWLIASAFRRGYYLEIESAGGRQRFCFGKQADRDKIETFLGTTEKCHRISIIRRA